MRERMYACTYRNSPTALEIQSFDQYQQWGTPPTPSVLIPNAICKSPSPRQSLRRCKDNVLDASGRSVRGL